jgi:ribonuclease Z
MELKLIFLGTGGSIPTPLRALPAVAVRRGGELMLFDCGEGTQSQMARAQLSPMKLSAIFITHLHGDHFLGLAGLVQTLSLMNRTRRLEIFCPPDAKERIQTYLRIPYYTLTFDVVVNEVGPGEEIRRDDYVIRTCEVEHQVPALAYALIEDPRPGEFYPQRAMELGVKPGPDFSRLQAGQSIELPDGRVVRPEQVMGPPRPGRKVVYAGDTRPCESLVELARGADVLIHDCTLANELSEMAVESGHSTPAEAAEVARRAGVGQLVLTHISPRYVDDEVLLRQAREIFQNVVVARDLMELEVKFKQ